MSPKHTELEHYENEEGSRDLIDLLQAARPSHELQAPADFHAKVMQRIAQLPQQEGLLAQWRKDGSMAATSWFTRLIGNLRSVVWHPAFAYGLALLLGIRVISHDLLPSTFSSPENEPVDVWRGIDSEGSPLASTPVVPAHLSPHEAATALLGAYQAAYEARDLGALSSLWSPSEEERAAVAQLFTESRRLSLLANVQSVQANEQGDQAAVTFAQVTTVLSADGRFYTKGPESYVADIRRGEDHWEIRDLHRVPD